MARKLSLACLTLLGVVLCCSQVQAHPDDYKLRDFVPAYSGPGIWPGAEGSPEGSGTFQSSGIELKSWISIPDFEQLTGIAQIDNGNSCWGYVSPSGEYAIMGLSSGTAFVEVTDPANPIFAGHIPGPVSLWRDMKTYQNYCYSISEGGSGIQVISLANIDGTSNRVSLVNTITTGGTIVTTATHTLAINTASGYLYRCGGGANGLRIYNLNPNPASPTYVAQWTSRYVHECLVLSYTSGPFAGKEIVFACSGLNGGFDDTGLDILDVTNKSNIVNLYPPRVHWTNPGYSHQIWLSEDRRYAYINDELDEQDFSFNTRTIVVDVSFLVDSQVTTPSVAGEFFGNTPAVGHNLYVKGDLIFESNYTAGLQVFCTELDRIHPTMVGYIDTRPEEDTNVFRGDWNNYPFFPSGTVILSDIQRGLFVLDVSGIQEGISVALSQNPPPMISPLGDTTIQAQITQLPCSKGVLQAGSATLNYDSGSGFVTLPMNSVGGNVYEATFPALPCGTQVDFYVSAENIQGTTFTSPGGAPASLYSAVVASGEAVSFTDNFQTDTGWTTSVSGATAGFWQRGVPVNDPGWAYDPASDFDGSGQCYLTQNTTGNSDVDGGSVTLQSANFDLTGSNAKITYAYFLRMTSISAGDGITVSVNNNGGVGAWTQVLVHNTNNGLTWQQNNIYASDLSSLGVTPTANMRIRFTAADVNPGNIVEAAIDAFRISSLTCETPVSCTKGDVNDDGFVNGADIQLFSETLVSGGIFNTVEHCATDMDSDGLLEQGEDLPLLVGCLLDGPCP